MDADIYYVTNPILLRRSDIYKKYGQIWFRDRISKWHRNGSLKNISNWVQDFFNRKNVQLPEQLKTEGLFQGESYHLQESGLIMVNKKKQKKMLEYLGKIHSDKDLAIEIYDHVHGDKETFWISSVMSNTEFSFNPWRVTITNKLRNPLTRAV